MAINLEVIKNIATKAGTAFNKVMSSGKIPEGSIFDAASKLGINNTDDLKGAWAKIKQNPSETIGNALNSLHDQGFVLGGFNQKKTENADAAVATQANPQAVAQEAQPAEEVPEANEVEETKAADSNPMDQMVGMLKSAGITNPADMTSILTECKDNPDKLSELIKKFTVGGGEENTLGMG